MGSENPVCRKLNAAIALSPKDLETIERILSNRLQVAAVTSLVADGYAGQEAYALLSGWACRFRMFEDGRRQISRLFLPGDFIGLNASLLGMPEQPVAALTDVRLAKVEGTQLMEALKGSHRIWLSFLWSDMRDRFITEERVASIGRRSAYERIAHMLMELYLRLELVGEATDSTFVLPLTQESLADVLGLTSIHVNRVLRRLKQDRLITVDARTIRILSCERLMQIAEFDPRYLMHGRHLEL